WLMMSLWDALRMNMMISYQELVRTFPKNPIFSTKWEGNSGKHLLVMKKEINQSNTAEYLSVKQVTKGKDDCISNDYIIDCEMDINLNGG
ncbi:hypothetical protein POY10_19915, partial [Klebsiella pneumoniae]